MLNTAFEPWPSFTEQEADAVKKFYFLIKSITGQGKNAANLKKNLPNLPNKICRCLPNGTVALMLH
jgi:hypothetical protein